MPGDLGPPAEIIISDNKFSITMSEAGTIDFLNIEGTFTSTTTVVGDYGWGVDGCGAGGKLPVALLHGREPPQPLFETVSIYAG